jgi:Flp pilus assembly protein TadG
MKYNHNIEKRRKGFGALEAVTSSIFVIVAVILSLDCWFMITAARVTDAACRDAARAAAQAPDSSTANNAALAAVQPYVQYANSMMTAPSVSVTYNDGANPPSVTVVTTMSVTPLVPLTCLGSSLSGVNFSQQYSFPLIKSMAGVGLTTAP